MERNTIKCPGAGCRNGRHTITVTYLGDDSKSHESEHDCYWCDGEGKVSQERYNDWVFYKNMWCKCSPSRKPGVTFFDDGEHKELPKHHYRCKGCKGVVQIG